MINKLPAYPAYRDSELPWVGAIPAHWDILRNGRLFTHRVETGFPDLPILEVSLRTGVRVRDLVNLKRKQMMTQKEKYKRAVKGDIAYNMMRMWQGALGVAPTDGLVSPAYVVVRPFDGANSAYYDYLFRTGAYMSEVNKYSRGIVSDRNRLYWDEFKQMPSIIPTRDEQDKIVAFLRVQDRQIARFIRDKRRLIELLNEQKQTIIHRAVTRGLDPNVRLRPSGIDWLGDVPEHWEIKPLKRWVEINSQALAENTDWNYEFQYIDIGTVQTGRLVRSLETMKFGKSPSRARRILRKGDTIVSTVRTYLRAVWYVDDDVVNLIASTGFAVLTPRTEVLPEFLGYIVQSSNFVDRVSANSTGIAYPAISESVLGRFTIAMPPSLDEQRDLVSWIESETAAIRQAIERTQTEIDLIREYRERLISDVVTGKVDVRGWTPSPEDLEADDEMLAVMGDDEEIPAEEEDDAND